MGQRLGRSPRTEERGAEHVVMGHARFEELRDLEDVLEGIRALAGVDERSPGIFYLHRSPFLHFHTKDGRRWADVKAGTEWGSEIAIPFDCPSRAKASFLREVCARHRATVDAGSRVSPKRAKKKGNGR